LLEQGAEGGIEGRHLLVFAHAHAIRRIGDQHAVRRGDRSVTIHDHRLNRSREFFFVEKTAIYTTPARK
jgi:hypothetical protein